MTRQHAENRQLPDTKEEEEEEEEEEAEAEEVEEAEQAEEEEEEGDLFKGRGAYSYPDGYCRGTQGARG